MKLNKLTYLLLFLSCLSSFSDDTSDSHLDSSIIMDIIKKKHIVIDLNDELIINESLKTLIADKNINVNKTVIDENLKFMEFEFSEKPSIKISKRDSYLHLSYNLSASIGNGPSSGVLNLIRNNTNFDKIPSQSSNVSIFFDYTKDYNYMERTFRVKNNKEDPVVALKNIPIKNVFRQGVQFKFEKTIFTVPLKIPERLFIWNESSENVYPCYFYDNDFYDITAEYKISYNCEKLPNFNDYGGTLKIIFDKTEFL